MTTRRILENIQKISGTTGIYYYVSEDLNKKIYVIEDKHRVYEECYLPGRSIRIDDLLRSLVLGTKEKVDVYIELDFPTSDKPFYSVVETNYLAVVQNAFLKCLQPDRRDCPYKNVRSHYVDFRSMLKETELVNLLANLSFLDDYVENEEDIQNLIKQIDDVLQNEDLYKETFKNEKTIMHFIDSIKNIDKIKKQFDSIEGEKKERIISILNEYVEMWKEKKVYWDVNRDESTRDRDILKYIEWKFIKSKLTEIRSELEKLELSELEQKSEKIREQLDYTYNLFVAITGLAMDLYAIGRVFRTFVHPDETRDSPKNIIIFAGSYHTNIYREIFNMLGFKLVFEKNERIQSKEPLLFLLSDDETVTFYDDNEKEITETIKKLPNSKNNVMEDLEKIKHPFVKHDITDPRKLLKNIMKDQPDPRKANKILEKLVEKEEGKLRNEELRQRRKFNMDVYNDFIKAHKNVLVYFYKSVPKKNDFLWDLFRKNSNISIIKVNTENPYNEYIVDSYDDINCISAKNFPINFPQK